MPWVTQTRRKNELSEEEIGCGRVYIGYCYQHEIIIKNDTRNWNPDAEPFNVNTVHCVYSYIGVIFCTFEVIDVQKNTNYF